MRRMPRIVCALLLLSCIALPARAEEFSLDTFAARAAAEQFLLLLDQGEYRACWENASELFRKSANKLQWDERMAHLRDQYGAYAGRRLRYSEAMKNVEGAPEGEYYFLIYGSAFANKESVIETLTLVKESDGLWRVSGYGIE